MTSSEFQLTAIGAWATAQPPSSSSSSSFSSSRSSSSSSSSSSASPQAIYTPPPEEDMFDEEVLQFLLLTTSMCAKAHISTPNRRKKDGDGMDQPTGPDHFQLCSLYDRGTTPETWQGEAAAE